MTQSKKKGRGQFMNNWNHRYGPCGCRGLPVYSQWNGLSPLRFSNCQITQSSSEKLILVLAFTCDRSVLVWLPSGSTTEERKGMWQLGILFYLFCCILHSTLSFCIVIVDEADQTEHGKVSINHGPQLEKWTQALCSETRVCHMPKWFSPPPHTYESEHIFLKSSDPQYP